MISMARLLFFDTEQIMAVLEKQSGKICYMYDLQFIWVSKDYDFAPIRLLLTIGMFCSPLLWVYYLGFLQSSHVGLLCWSLIAVLVGGICVRFCF
ncbi:hypothetical protein PRUPE_1G003800 [Prunus persica]|uniref:Uncharacterized protein n=1 Tax=Prunus persica TaxID=3760 RepID=M5XA79_PRUPE|nr:hypothetical protein PRUPE_1G003800 [Prunus persica]